MNRSPEEIKEDMLDNIKNTEDKSENSFIHDAIAPASLEFFEAYREQDFTRGKLNVENLEGGELDRYVNQQAGVNRKLATHSDGIVKITGKKDTVVEEGLVVIAGDVSFTVQESKTIEDNNISVRVRSDVEGSIGNLPEGAINEFQEVNEDLLTVTNPEPLTNGYDEENDLSLLDRYYERIRTPATSGNKYHYMNWAKEVEGVGDAKVFPLWDGDNTVKVIIINSNKGIADEELIERVQVHIDPDSLGLGEGEAPIGAFTTVVSATAKDINISVELSQNSLIEDAISNIKEAINNYLKETAFTDTIVSYAKIGSLILDAEGVLDYSELTINGGVSNIEVSGEEVAVLGEVVANE